MDQRHQRRYEAVFSAESAEELTEQADLAGMDVPSCLVNAALRQMAETEQAEQQVPSHVLSRISPFRASHGRAATGSGRFAGPGGR